MHPTELTLANIDSIRHLTTSEEVVRAVGFAVRAGHANHTAYRFVTALVMTDNLIDRTRAEWARVLVAVMDLERADEATREHVHAFEVIASWPAGPDGETGTLRACSCGEQLTTEETTP